MGVCLCELVYVAILLIEEELTLFEQLCAPMYAGRATAAQKPKRTLSASMAMSTIGMLNFSMKDVGRKYSNVNNHQIPTNSE